MELQISYSICAKVSEENLLQRKQGGNRENTERIMQLETDENAILALTFCSKFSVCLCLYVRIRGLLVKYLAS